MLPRISVLSLCVLGVLGGGSRAAEAPTYWQDVRPILRKHCTVCHSERKLAEPDVSAGLALDKPELVRKGGKVPVLVAGKPDQSLLVTLLTTTDKKRAMPLDADPLPAADVAVIRRWVEAGAPEGTKPADDDPGVIAAPATTAKVRKLNVTFATKAVLPKTSPTPGGLELTLPVGPLPPVAAVAFSPDGTLLAVGSYGRVTVWDLTTAKPARVLTNVLGAVNDLKFSPDGKTLAVAGGQPSARGDLRLFDTADWALAASLGGHLDTVSGVAWSPDGTKLASASFDKTVRLWDVKSKAVLHTFTGHSDFVYAVAFAPSGEWYATASKDKTSRLIETATGKSRLTFSGSQELLTVAVRPDGARVVASGLDTALFWWDAQTGERVATSPGVGVATHEVAFDPKGATVAAGGASGTVRTYDPKAGAAGKAIATGGPVFAVAVDPTGKRLATGGAEGTVKVWDAADTRLLATFWSGTGSGDAGDWLAFTPEGYFAASDGAAAKAVWKAGGKPVTDPAALAPLAVPAVVAKAARGEKVPDPVWK